MVSSWRAGPPEQGWPRRVLLMVLVVVLLCCLWFRRLTLWDVAGLEGSVTVEEAAFSGIGGGHIVGGGGGSEASTLRVDEDGKDAHAQVMGTDEAGVRSYA
jgi:hypothetical protein